MQVVCHDIEPVDDLRDGNNIEVLHIPVGGRDGYSQPIFVTRRSQCILEILQEGDIVLIVIRVARALGCDWILPGLSQRQSSEPVSGGVNTSQCQRHQSPMSP